MPWCAAAIEFLSRCIRVLAQARPRLKVLAKRILYTFILAKRHCRGGAVMVLYGNRKQYSGVYRGPGLCRREQVAGGDEDLTDRCAD